MSPDNTLREELLRENGIPPKGLSEEDRKKLEKLLRRDRSRARQSKWIAIAAFGSFAFCYLVAFTSKSIGVRVPDWLQQAGVALSIMIFFIALVYSVGFLIRWTIVNDRETKIHRCEVEARLANVEDTLKTLVKGSAEHRSSDEHGR